MSTRKAGLALTALLAVAACSTDPVSPAGRAPKGPAFSHTGSHVVVSPSNMNGWFFYDDNADVINNALGSFVTGPGSPPGGIGSAQVSTTTGQRPNLATYQFSGTPLADITALRFYTYNPSAGNSGSADRSGYLHFNVDFNNTDTWQRRLVFVPNQNGTIIQNQWQEWDAINGGNAMWSYSGTTWPVTGEPGSTLKSWSQILSDYPGVRMRVTDSFLGIRVGEPYTGSYTENIDVFTFGTAGGTKQFDFEPYEVASSRDACMNGGWQSLRRANGSSFKNQGDCVSYASNGK